LAGAVRAMVMVRKTAIASNNDNNRVDGNDSNNDNNHDNNSVKDGDSNEDSENDDKDKDDENDNATGTTTKTTTTMNDDYETMTSTMMSTATMTTMMTTTMTTMMTTTKTSTATMDNLAVIFYNIAMIIWAAFVIGHGLMLLLSIDKWRDLLNSQSLMYDGDRQAPPDLSNLLPEGTDLDPDTWLTRHELMLVFLQWIANTSNIQPDMNQYISTRSYESWI
jgi:hypothetical protein